MKDDRLYVLYILECIARIAQYTAEGREAFFADAKTQEHPEIDWRGIYTAPH